MSDHEMFGLMLALVKWRVRLHDRIDVDGAAYFDLCDRHAQVCGFPTWQEHDDEFLWLQGVFWRHHGLSGKTVTSKATFAHVNISTRVTMTRMV